MPSMKEYDAEGHLSQGDVLLDNIAQPTAVQLRIKTSKTDPFRKGVSLYLGQTGNELCPVVATTAYLAVRGRSPGPLFRFEVGATLSREGLVQRVREALQPSGMDMSKYSAHSFRIGAATTAAMVGVEDSLIKTLGGGAQHTCLIFKSLGRDWLPFLISCPRQSN